MIAISIFFLVAFPGLAWAATGTVPPQAGASSPSMSPLEFIGSFYQFALLIGGVLAFGSIVYAGIKYTIAAGNPGGQSDAKEHITEVLLGLLLLVGAAIILYTINPGLTSLQLPALKQLRTPEGSGNSPVCNPPCTGGTICRVGSGGVSGCQPIFEGSGGQFRGGSGSF